MTVTPIRSLEGIRCGNGAAACRRARAQQSRDRVGGSVKGTDCRHQEWEKKGETRLEFERVDADGDGTDHAGIEFLVVRLALGAPDVGQFPFEVCSRRGRRLHPSRRDASKERARERVSVSGRRG
jgi:hypothetical protein